jgi:ankyrin repeat protein
VIEISAALLEAAKVGNLRRVKECIEFGACIGYKDPNNNTALQLAAFGGHFEVCNFIRSLTPADYVVKEKSSWSLIEASRGGDIDIARTAVADGADCNYVDEDNWTPLHHASYLGHFDLCKFLISQGVNIDARSICGETPLHLAASAGRVKSVFVT